MNGMKNVRRMMAVAMILIMAMSIVACGSKNGKDGQKASDAKNDDKTFVVGFDQDFPPFGYVGDDGEFTGFDIEMAQECAKRMGQEIVLQPIDWDAKDMELESGTIDCIWNGFTINGREDQYTWTDAYMDNSQVVVVRADSGIETLADLEGKNVEVQKESSAQSAIEDNEELMKTFGELRTVGEYNTAIMDLESGAVDAIAMDIFVAKDQIADKDGELIILDQQISTEQYAIGFKKGNTALRDQVQTTLMDMVKDGTFAKISDKWFGMDVCILEP